MLTINIINKEILSKFSITQKLLANFAQTFIEKQQIIDKNHDFTISLLLCNNDKITELNCQYRNKDNSTNILSFPAFKPAELTQDKLIEELYLGDIAVSTEKIIAEAELQKKTKQAHFMHLITHGCLHLLGYDHINEKEANIMEKLEIDILAELGYDNPYLI